MSFLLNLFPPKLGVHRRQNSSLSFMVYVAGLLRFARNDGLSCLLSRHATAMPECLFIQQFAACPLVVWPWRGGVLSLRAVFDR